ncbi:Esbp6p KNAG_0I02160 [Huiozyma naganishii CBS 8797]|uniref:Major facilitator superfamily (MFS) profile domain-containing protein n=1 Tax=Huiozyma naganishii (strain ATCC MYA-139 / BCRC 22969 / CBS 8797 / KCTC 17520 / NBRC 10181 / NCYC 3082 / Yp74L-3) TaxID=1071383 RepID=J7SAB0_HUIN7|nr:hypothetical protein KNAG_0I02160 [Kazachstania naganishii CBS 8797]CCK72001.1 hypothetical protein KNAG_0I02160 [Kazachstania naganishii CBS 8797]
MNSDLPMSSVSSGRSLDSYWSRSGEAPVQRSDSWSQVSRVASLARTVTMTVSDVIDAVRDDNQQTERDRASDDLNKVLESRFDVGDALRMEQNNASDSDQEEVESHVDEVTKLPSEVPGGKRETLERVFTSKEKGNVVDLPPDKGYAWVVVLSVFLVMFNTWGCNSAFGVFLSFFLSHGTFEGASKYDYALIAGLTVALGQGFSPFAMIIMRVIGLRTTMFLGCMLMLAGFLLASFATRLWELYLTQGVLIGISISLIFAPATTVLPGWFLKKRAVSMGLSLFGTGAGGVTFGLASEKMIADRGNTRWCYRMLAITCTCAVLFAISLVRERHPIKSVGLRSIKKVKREVKKMFNWQVIKQPQVLLIAVWFTLALLAYNLMVFTLASYAVARGMTLHQGSSLTAILNGAQACGRPIMGLMGDRFGRANVTIALTSLLCIYMFAFWIPAHTYLQLIMFSIMVGSCVGVANVMNTVLIADMVKPDEFLSAWGFVNYSGSPALLCCEVIAQALTKQGVSNPYLHTQIFAGVCFSSAWIMILVLREYAVRLKLDRRRQENDKKMQEHIGNKQFEEADSDSSAEHWSTLEKREIKYNFLLGGGIKRYFMRLSYPMKI